MHMITQALREADAYRKGVQVDHRILAEMQVIVNENPLSAGRLVPYNRINLETIRKILDRGKNDAFSRLGIVNNKESVFIRK